MLENKQNSAVGRVNALLTFNAEGQEQAIVTPLVAKVHDRVDDHEFGGVCSFTEKTQKHLLEIVLPSAGSLFSKLQLPQQNFHLSIVNIGGTSLHNIGITTSGFSADAAVYIAAVSAGLQIPVDQGLAITGHIASCDGDIKAVKNIPAKIKAAIDSQTIHTMIIPDIDSDVTAQTLSPLETDKIQTAILQARDLIKIVKVNGVYDLVKAVFPLESIVKSSFLLKFYEPLLLPLEESTPVANAASYLNFNNENRFWQVLEAMLFQELFDDARKLIQIIIHYYNENNLYPKEFGRKIYKLFISLPPATLRNFEGSLFEKSELMRLIKVAEDSDFEDLKLLLLSSSETPSELLPSNINQDSAGNDKILDLADRISEKISKQALSKIGMPIDHARSVYVMNSIRVSNISELNQAVASFYLFILRHLNKITDPVDQQQATEEAFALVERAFANQGGYKMVCTEAITPTQGGLRFIFDTMTDQLKREEQEKYINYIFKTTVEPLSKEEKGKLLKTIIVRLKQFLPAEVVATPESYTEHYAEIFRHYVNSTDHVRSLFNSI